MHCNAISFLQRSLEGLHSICHASCAAMQTFIVSSPFSRALRASSSRFSQGEGKPGILRNSKGSLNNPWNASVRYMWCGWSYLGWTRVRNHSYRTYFLCRYLCPPLPYCKDFMPKLASYPSKLWDICFVRVICNWIKFLCKPFISYCALVYWGHPRLTCKTAGDAFFAHSVILTWGIKS